MFKGTPSIPETYLSSSVAWGLNLRVGWWRQILKKCKFSNQNSGRIVRSTAIAIQACKSCSRALDATIVTWHIRHTSGISGGFRQLRKQWPPATSLYATIVTWHIRHTSGISGGFRQLRKQWPPATSLFVWPVPCGLVGPRWPGLTSQGQGQLDRGLAGRDYPALVPHSMQTVKRLTPVYK